MNSIRIIGGVWRRRIVRFPDSEHLRPTPDRVRETLFNWLGQDLSGLSCLDLFAGSGALGFEALSRGASHVTLVECAPPVLRALEKNARMLSAEGRLRILALDAIKFAALPPERCFDVIFLDPPYRQGWIERLTPFISRLAKNDASIYMESEQPLRGCGDWRTMRSGKAGQVYFHLMRKVYSNGVEPAAGDLCGDI